MDAADENGIGISFEGTWPWLMINASMPDEKLITMWADEFMGLLKKYRNHPSLLFWTVNNEMKFYDNEPDIEKAKMKMKIIATRTTLGTGKEVLTFTDDGVKLHDSETLPPEVTAAIESISVNETITDGGRTVKKSVKLHNKLTALGFLSNYFGINDDFNQARATLKRYGLALVEDPSNPSGWSIKPYET
jgi:hypothetical protein